MSGIAARRRMASDQVFALEHLRTEFRIDGA
jgi:hypothetical protein